WPAHPIRRTRGKLRIRPNRTDVVTRTMFVTSAIVHVEVAKCKSQQSSMFLPNGKIHFKSALIGGIVAGVIYQGVQWAYIHFQVGASSAGAIYGTFGALALFLAWLQTSWVIVLFGGGLASAHHTRARVAVA